LRHQTNVDLVELLTEVIDAARSTPSLRDPGFARYLDDLKQRERARRQALLAGCDLLRSRLDDVVLPGIGARRDPELRLLPGPAREGLARHAAAVALAFTVATAAACSRESTSPSAPVVPAETVVGPVATTAPIVSASAAPPGVASSAPAVDAQALAQVDAMAPAAPEAGAVAAVVDAGKPKPRVQPPPPHVVEHYGISEFAAPPLQPSKP
jgi:hypothetical protein